MKRIDGRWVPTETRFWMQTRVSNECWEWIGAKDSDGYGWLRHNGKGVSAHRYSFELHYGFIGEDNPMCVLHHCDNPCCVNPDHLFLGTHQDNSDDKMAKGRDVVLRGEDNGFAKLTEDDVRAIRSRYVPRHPKNGGAALSREFGVEKTEISRIIKRLRWKHVI